MTAPTGGRWVFSSSLGPVVLGINDGVHPVFPTQQGGGAYNIEVFTNPAVIAQWGGFTPPPDPGWNATAADAGGTLENGFLTGSDIRLGAGNFLVIDSVTGAAGQSPSKISLGGGNQTVVGARFDTLIGGAPGQVFSALLGNETVVGSGSIWGGQADSIVGSGQIVVTGAQTTVVASGAATISLAAQDTVLSLPANSGDVVIAAGANNWIDLTGSSGLDAVIGSNGDTIIAGGAMTNVEGAAGGMLIQVGAAGLTNVSGSTSLVAGNTIYGGVGALNYNPSLVAGKGDLFDLSGTTGSAQINAFSFGVNAIRVAAPDTILANNSFDSVFGGDGDRVGTGNGSVVGGIHQWVHADPAAGSAVGFGSNDTIASTAYDTVSGTATRGTVAGTSSAQVTVGGFNTAADFLFYQDESAATNGAIVATAQPTTIGGTPSSIVTLPDGTVMTLVGVTVSQLTVVLGTGTLFKP